MKLKLNSSVNGKRIDCDDMEWQNCQVKASPDRSKLNAQDLGLSQNDETRSTVKDAREDITQEGLSSHKSILKDTAEGEFIKQGSEESVGKFDAGENNSNQLVECENEHNEDEKEELEIKIDNALDQCFFCLYGLNLRCDSSYDDDLSLHKNTSRGDYQTKEQCADVFQYILPYAKASSVSTFCKRVNCSISACLAFDRIYVYLEKADTSTLIFWWHHQEFCIYDFPELALN